MVLNSQELQWEGGIEGGVECLRSGYDVTVQVRTLSLIFQLPKFVNTGVSWWATSMLFECLFCGYDITIQEEPLNLSFGFQTKELACKYLLREEGAFECQW